MFYESPFEDFTDEEWNGYIEPLKVRVRVKVRVSLGIRVRVSVRVRVRVRVSVLRKPLRGFHG